MSYVHSGEIRYAFVFDEQLWRKVKKAMFSGNEFAGWSDDDFAVYLAEENDENSIQAIPQIDGEAMSEVDAEYEFSEFYARAGDLDWGDNPKFLTPSGNINTFKRSYKTQQELIDEYKSRLAAMGLDLPDDYQYARHISKIKTVRFG